jgi:hypothetical protein
MSSLLEKDLRAAARLPAAEQDRIAHDILDEIEEEARWQATFARSQDQLASPDFSQRVDGARSRALRTERGAPVGDLGSRSEDGARIRACDRDDEPALLCVEVQKAAARCR